MIPDTTPARSLRCSTVELLALGSLLLVLVILILHRLGSGPCDVSGGNAVTRFVRSGFCGADICGTNEAIEGVFVQDMVERGHFLFPVGHGGEPMYKPPLFHWTAFAIDRLFGLRKVTAFNLRLPSTIYAVAGGILVMAFALLRFGPGVALLSGLILAGSFQYAELARIGRVDMTLTFFEALALFAFLGWLPARGHTPSSRIAGMRYLFAIALGCAVLAKGPVGMLLPCIAIAIVLILERRLTEEWHHFIPGPALVAIAIASSWYLACFVGGRYGYLDRQIGSENFGRFFGVLGSMPPWYYLKPLLLNSGPLSLIAPVAIVSALRLRRPPEADPELDEAERRRDALRVMAVFWLVTVVFFSLAAYKRRAYLLPLWPVSAVIMGWWLESLGRSLGARFTRAAFAMTCACLVIFNFVYLPLHALHACGDETCRPAALAIDHAVGPHEPLFIYGFRGPLAPLVFYLDRDVRPINGRLGDAPPGYVIVPASAWAQYRHRAPGLTPVLIAPYGRLGLILLSHGRFYAMSQK